MMRLPRSPLRGLAGALLRANTAPKINTVLNDGVQDGPE